MLGRPVWSDTPQALYDAGKASSLPAGTAQRCATSSGSSGSSSAAGGEEGAPAESPLEQPSTAALRSFMSFYLFLSLLKIGPPVGWR